MSGKRAISINGADCGTEALMLGVITSIGGFLFGFDTGQISGLQIFRDFIDRFATNTDPQTGLATFDETLLAVLVSLMSIGSLFGALSAAYTSDYFGRRKSLALGVLVFIIGNIIQIASFNSWGQFTAGRFIAGLGVGNLSVGVPMYQSETVPKEIRGAVVASYQLMITIGILVSNAVNYGVRNIETSDASWRIVIGLGIAFSLPLGFGVLLIPESPRWYAGQDRWDDALKSIGRLRGNKDNLDHPLVQEDFKEMKDDLDADRQSGTGTWAECFTGQPSGIPKLVYRTFLGFAIHLLQQWTGVNYFFYYGATIFQSAGVDDPIQTQLILGAVNVVTTFFGLYAVEKFGRRMPLFIGGLWQCAWLVIFAAIGTAVPPTENPAAGIVMIVAACMFIASFASTWGPFAWVVIGELYPRRTRAKQASIATAGNWLGNWMIAFFSPIADRGISYNLGYVFAGCNLAGALIVWFFLYETRNLSLENVNNMYSTEGLTAMGSKKWVPQGYITREKRDPKYFHAESDEATPPLGKNKSLGDQKPQHMETAPSGDGV